MNNYYDISLKKARYSILKKYKNFSFTKNKLENKNSLEKVFKKFKPSIVIHLAILVPLAFTNAIFIDAERDGANWLKEWKEEQNRWTIVTNRLKKHNLTLWDPNKEA